MNIILIVLTSTLLSAFFVGFTYLGFYLGKKYQTKENEKQAVHINEKNKEAYENVLKWMGFKGVK